MSSTLLPSGQSKSWWSRSKSSRDPSSTSSIGSLSSQTDVNEKSVSSMSSGTTKPRDSTSGLRFKSIGSAMGFKSRKLPVLAIQDPPSIASPRIPHTHVIQDDSGAREGSSTPSPLYTNNLSAKSFLTTRSSEYDGDETKTASEPRTPSEPARDRTSYQPSVLTFSEMDPFAAGGVIIQQTANDANRLSVYSDSSMLDPHTKSSDIVLHNRISYGSSSSNSYSRSSDSHSGRFAPPLPAQSLTPIRSRQNSTMEREVILPLLELQDAPLRRKIPTGSNSSSSTVTSMDVNNRLSEPPRGQPFLQHGYSAATARARPRGMTIATAGSSGVRRPSTANAVVGLSPLVMSPPPVAPLQLHRKASDPSYGLRSLSSSRTSHSPVMFTRSRSSTTNSNDSHLSSTHPLVVVRKASSSTMQLPPLSRAPPSSELPPPPQSPSLSFDGESLNDLSAFPDPPSSSSSSISFAPSMKHEFDNISGDMISHLMRQTYGQSGKQTHGKKAGRSRSTRQAHAKASTSVFLRDLELDTAPLHSGSKSPLLRAGRGEPVPLDGGEGSQYSPLRHSKKASSQQSLLAKRYSGASTASSHGSGCAYQDDYGHGKSTGPVSTVGKAPRKQRSFHRSRLPLPPLPTLRHANSSTGPADLPSPTSTASPTDQRRGSLTNHSGPSTRKRLFSGSSIRRSMSSQPPHSPSLSGDDDVRSINSIEEFRTAGQKLVMSFGNFGNPLSLLTSNSCVAPSSHWEDTNVNLSTALQSQESDRASKRESQAEYTPQHIMSPADMLKLEQQLAEEAEAKDRDHERRDKQTKLELHMSSLGDAFIGGRRKADVRSPKARTDSIFSMTSTGTLAFGEKVVHSDATLKGLTPSPSSTSGTRSITTSPSKAEVTVDEASRVPLRSSSVIGKSISKPSLSLRPSTAQPNLSSPISSVFTSHSPEQLTVSLPPPPRSRPTRDQQQHSKQAQTDSKRASTVPLHPLCPPPVRNKPRMQSSPVVETREPQFHTSRPPSAFDQKVFKRRSIMRKPSFLDIEDELDATTESLLEVELDAPPSPVIQSSFLDMERGKDSFETVRSSDSLLYF